MSDELTVNNSIWLSELVDECRTIFTETNFAERWARIEGYHGIGLRVLQEFEIHEQDKYGKKIVSSISKSIGVGTRTVWRMAQFASKFPSIEVSTLPEGKDTSWTKIVSRYLSEPSEAIGKALPDREYMKDVINHNLDFLLDHMKQNKKGVSFFLPYSFIDKELEK